jgi:hypothetical protein
MARTAGPSDLATPASCTGQADQTGTAGGARTWAPADRTVLKTARAASAESEVRPGTQAADPTRPPSQTPAGEPEALNTSSLPTMAA